jgi:hypothetical protein
MLGQGSSCIRWRSGLTQFSNNLLVLSRPMTMLLPIVRNTLATTRHGDMLNRSGAVTVAELRSVSPQTPCSRGELRVAKG